MQYNIYCYKLKYNSSFSFKNFKLSLPFAESYTTLNNIIFSDTNTYTYTITNTNNQAIDPTIEELYITQPYNLNSLSKLEVKIDLKRKAHPGMKIKVQFSISNSLFIEHFT